MQIETMSSKILSWRKQCFKAQQSPEIKPPSETQWIFLLDYHIHTSISAWIYENWISKHFVVCFNFPRLAYVILFYFICLEGGEGGIVLWLGICVEMAVEGILWICILSNPHPPPPSISVSFPKEWFSVPTQNSLLQVTVIWNQCT